MPSDTDFAARLATFKSSRYKKLRESQASVLAEYAKNSELPDFAIELPTGYGKTLVALLIADYALERGFRVAYLTGTNQLTDQVLAQAADLPNLVALRFSSQNYPPASLASYNNAKAIGVMNYWTYFNTSPKVEAADVLIFDDAHLAEQPLAGLFAIRIERVHASALYEQLCDLVLAHTDLYPSIELMREGSAGPTTAPELLAFPHWKAIADRAAQLITNGLPGETRRFVWPIVRPRLAACGVLIGPSAIEIRPYHPPTQTLAGYRSARQRLYLSATLGTMDDLQRRLGVAPVVSAVDATLGLGEVGERVFILNPSDDSALGDGPISFALTQAAVVGRTAWLCASNAEADAVEAMLRSRGYPTYRLGASADDDVLDRWSVDARGHLVTAGRYDGFDFAGDLCRLVVLPSVPAASTEFERFVMAYLGDATFMRHRVGQRVTQALGRANRREGDWAMYLGLSPSFGTLLAQSAVQAAIPPDVRPTIDAALVRAGHGWSRAEEAAQQFWATHRADSSPALPPSSRIRPGRQRAAATAGSAPDEVSAVTSLWLDDLRSAAAAAGRAAATLSTAGETEHAAFWWYVQAQAMFAEGPTDGLAQAIGALRTATGPTVPTAWFVRLRRVLAELRGEQASRTSEAPWLAWDTWVREAGEAGVRRAVARCRIGVMGTHDQQAEALETLGRMLGLEAHRPKGQAQPDAVWNWAIGRRVETRLWEVKTGTPNAIPRDWIDQALGQLSSYGRNARAHVVACVLSQVDSIGSTAGAAADGVLIVHLDAVQALIDRVADRLLDYATRWGGGSAAERGAARAAVEPRLPSGSWLGELFSASGKAPLRRGDVEARFPSG